MEFPRTLIGLLVLFLASGAFAATNVPCEVTGYGMYPGGESFSGSALDLGADEAFDLQHSASGLEFEVTSANPSDISCNIDAVSHNADFLGSSNATVNGVSGYSFLIYIEDNRGPPDTYLLTASIEHSPTRRSDGVAAFDPPREIVIPEEIPVTVGASGMGRIKLHLDDITCRYSGTGTAYVFENCTDPYESGYTPGTMLTITDARLRLLSADSNYDTTVVSVDIGTGATAPGEPDFYQIQVYDAAGAPFYTFSGDVFDGDISIEQVFP